MMWYRRAVPFLAVALVAACGGDQDEAVQGEAVQGATDPAEAIAALGDYWETHFNMQHPDMVASKYVDTAWVAPADGGWVEGRDQIQTWLTELEEMSPTAEITPVETLVFGDQAMGIGSYSVSGTGPDGNPMEMSGTYMNALADAGGEWMLVASMNNYDAPRPEGWEWAEPMEGETPPDIENEFTPVIEAFESAYNSGDPAAIAALYTDDALVAYSDGPILRGPGAVQTAMGDRMENGGTLVIHQLGTNELDGTHAGSGGWYEIQGPDGATVQTGFWWNLMEMEDGTPKIRWTVTNAWPMGV
jgi:ketosteroid isomerase-like protein